MLQVALFELSEYIKRSFRWKFFNGIHRSLIKVSFSQQPYQNTQTTQTFRLLDMNDSHSQTHKASTSYNALQTHQTDWTNREKVKQGERGGGRDGM